MTPPQPPGRLLSSAVVAGATAVQTLTSLGVSILPAVAPLAAAALGVSPSLLGLQMSLLYGLAVATSLLSGRCVRRFGAVRMSQAALALVAAGTALASVPSLATIAFASMLMGAAYGLPGPAASHLLTRFTAPGRRNLIFSIKQTGVPLGGALAGLLAPSLAQAFDWRAPLLAASCACALLCLLFAPARSRLDGDREPALPVLRLPVEGLRTVLSVAPLRPLAGVGGLLAAVQVCLTAFLVTILVEVYGFAPVSAGLAMAAVQVAGVTGRILWGLVADRAGGGATLIALAGTTAALAAALILLGPSDRAVALAAFLALGATAIGWNGVFLAEVARLAPAGRVSEATAVLLAGTYLGVFIGPALFGALTSLVGYPPGFALLAAGGAAAGLCAVSARRRARAPSP